MTGMREWLQAGAAERVRLGRVRRDDVRRNAETQGGLLDLASNDYLGLAGDERLHEAALEATRRFGTGASPRASSPARPPSTPSSSTSWRGSPASPHA